MANQQSAHQPKQVDVILVFSIGDGCGYLWDSEYGIFGLGVLEGLCRLVGSDF
jgi:hypothetical protein